MAFNFSRKDSSGSNFFSAQASNLGCSTLVMTLKSLQPPQTTRWTPLTPSTFLRSSRTVPRSFCASWSDFLSLSSLHLQRHSLFCFDDAEEEGRSGQVRDDQLFT